MSRIGKQEIVVPDGINVDLRQDEFITKKGNLILKTPIPYGIRVSIDNRIVRVFRNNDSKQLRALHGLTRKLIWNSVAGFSNPFRKILQIKGVGFKASVSGKKLILNIGFSHSIDVDIPTEISVNIDLKQNCIIFESYDKNKLGEFVASIRNLRSPEPYKGTGIMYVNEKINRKAGKSASSKK